MVPINISLRTLTISYDYLRCRVITIRRYWINSDIKQIYPLRFVSIGQKLSMLRFIVNYGNLKQFTGNRKWPRYVYTIYLNQVCIGPTKTCLLGLQVNLILRSVFLIRLLFRYSCNTVLSNTVIQSYSANRDLTQQYIQHVIDTLDQYHF